MEQLRDRGVSPVIGVILMVAIVVLLAAVIFVFTSGLAGEEREPAPTVDAETDEFVAGCAGCGPNDQVIRIVHDGGDPVEMEHVEVDVRFENRPVDSRLVNLPVENSGCNDLEPRNYEGDDIYDGGCAGVQGALNANDPDGRWSSGEELRFRIPKGDLTVNPGGEVTVKVIHTESDSVVVEKTLEAVDKDVS